MTVAMSLPPPQVATTPSICVPFSRLGQFPEIFGVTRMLIGCTAALMCQLVSETWMTRDFSPVRSTFPFRCVLQVSFVPRVFLSKRRWDTVVQVSAFQLQSWVDVAAAGPLIVDVVAVGKEDFLEVPIALSCHHDSPFRSCVLMRRVTLFTQEEEEVHLEHMLNRIH